MSVTDSGPRPTAGANGKTAPAPGARLAGPGLDGTGFGLAGSAERVASCGGNLTVGPTPAGGFAVTKLGLPPAGEDHRRVLAVLTYLRC